MTKSNGSTAPAHQYVFPRRDRFESAVKSLPTTIPRWAGEEGPRFRLELSPGARRITSTDLALKNRTANSQIESHLRKDADMLIAELQAAKKKTKRGEIKSLTLKARSRMALRLATIDYSPLFAEGRTPAMLTLTMPHDWITVAPTAPAFKKIVNRFRARYEHAWGAPIAGVWKMEFQWRKKCHEDGCHDPAAPHMHIIMTPPEGVAYAPLSFDDYLHLYECKSCDAAAHTGRYAFPEWVARAWAASVGHPDPLELYKHERAGTAVDYKELENYSDPKRVGIYFAKHGLYADKEYQNVMPAAWRESAGGARYWGYWVVRPMIVSKEIHEALIMHITRHFRALSDRNSYSRVVTTKWTREYSEVETDRDGGGFAGADPLTGEVSSRWVIASHKPGTRKRKVHRRVKRWRNVRGFEVVNDGLAGIADVARIIAHHLDSLSEREGYDIRLLSSFDDRPDWFDESDPPQWGQTETTA